MNTEFNSSRLRIARNTLGMSLDSLVEQLGNAVTKQAISKYERGLMTPKPQLVQKIADALGVKEDYFYGKGIDIDIPMLRSTSRDRLTDEEEHRLAEHLACVAERYILLEEKTALQKRFFNPLANIWVSNKSEAEQAAILLRKEWQIGNGEIPSITRLLERKGIRIFMAPMPSHILGVSTWGSRIYPIIALSDNQENTTVERTRFTVAHELGHLLLNIPPGCDNERICNQFAGTLLLPPQTLKEEIGEKRSLLTLEEMIDLRMVYGMSIAALIHQAYDLEIISEDHYNWWFDRLINNNKKEIGWGRYIVPETIGRERRLKSIAEEQKANTKFNTNNLKK